MSTNKEELNKEELNKEELKGPLFISEEVAEVLKKRIFGSKKTDKEKEEEWNELKKDICII